MAPIRIPIQEFTMPQMQKTILPVCLPVAHPPFAAEAEFGAPAPDSALGRFRQRALTLNFQFI
jgi:hypothetical protein